MTTEPRDAGSAKKSSAVRESYDHRLPILRELEAELELELRALEQSRPPTRGATPPSRAVAASSSRIVRRALVLVALTSLIGASALAGRSVLVDPRPQSSKSVVLASGGHGVDGWQLQAYLHEGSVCYALFVSNSAASSCGAPGARGVRATSALSPNRRFLVGFAGAKVMTVLVSVAGRAKVVSTSALGAVPGAPPARLLSPPRWFVTSMLRLGGAPTPAWVTARDRFGHALGGPVLDCSLGGSSEACQGAASRLAAPEERR